MNYPVKIDYDTYGLLCDDCFFVDKYIIKSQQANVIEMHILRHHQNVQRIYQFTPVVIDGKYHVFIVKHLDKSLKEQYNDQYEHVLALKQLRSVTDVNIQKGSIPSILLDCIDNNPDFN